MAVLLILVLLGSAYGSYLFISPLIFPAKLINLHNMVAYGCGVVSLLACILSFGTAKDVVQGRIDATYYGRFLRSSARSPKVWGIFFLWALAGVLLGIAVAYYMSNAYRV